MVGGQLFQRAEVNLVIIGFGSHDGTVDGFLRVHRTRGHIHLVVDGLDDIRDAAQVDGFEVVNMCFA